MKLIKHTYTEFTDGYLHRTPIDPKTNKRYLRLLKTLEEAKKEAIRIQCGGITKVKNGYKLREGKTIMPSPCGEQSIILKIKC